MDATRTIIRRMLTEATKAEDVGLWWITDRGEYIPVDPNSTHGIQSRIYLNSLEDTDPDYVTRIDQTGPLRAGWVRIHREQVQVFKLTDPVKNRIAQFLADQHIDTNSMVKLESPGFWEWIGVWDILDRGITADQLIYSYQRKR
jgi:hypothetical protein